MGAAAYIGRVGGLAVALGVGTAIATGYGVAAADDAPASPPPSGSSDTADASASAATDTTATTDNRTATTDTKTSTDSSTPAPDKSTTSAGTTTTTVKDGTVVSAQTNTGTTGTTGATTEPTQPTEPTTEPTETAAPEPTQTPETEASTETPKAKPTNVRKASTKTAEESTTSVATRTVGSVTDPTAGRESTDPVAVFADARTLAAASPTRLSPMMAAAQVTSIDTAQPTVTTTPENPLTAVTRLVSNVLGFVLNPLAGNMPTTPAQPPLIWSLLAFARKEFDNFFSALAGGTTETASPVARLTSLALATINPIPPRPAFPTPGQQLSPSTNFVDWVTGNFLPNNTSQRFSIWGTDVGTMWDNGIPDDPSTPYNEHQILIAVGDTFSGANMTGDWRSNTILRSGDTFLVDGMSIPDGEWFNGNMFGGAPLSSPTTARQVIFPGNLPAGVTLIPTAGISLPTPGTRFGATQYMSFMSVTQWGAPGSWTTNYSAIAYSTDNGENWTVAPQSVRYNQPWSGNQNFQQSAFVRPGDGYVYAYGTPNGRQGAAYLSRVAEKDILDLSKYDYYSSGTAGGWFGWGATPAGWYRNDPSKATPVFGQDTGACGVANPGNQVSEMSVQYNKSLKKYVVLYGDQFNNIVMRTSDTPQGTWSSAKVLLAQQNGGIYAPMMHPWSPSTMGTGTDLYWNLSLWSEYNVMLMRTDLTKV